MPAAAGTARLAPPRGGLCSPSTARGVSRPASLSRVGVALCVVVFPHSHSPPDPAHSRFALLYSEFSPLSIFAFSPRATVVFRQAIPPHLSPVFSRHAAAIAKFNVTSFSLSVSRARATYLCFFQSNLSHRVFDLSKFLSRIVPFPSLLFLLFIILLYLSLSALSTLCGALFECFLLRPSSRSVSILLRRHCLYSFLSLSFARALRLHLSFHRCLLRQYDDRLSARTSRTAAHTT